MVQDGATGKIVGAISKPPFLSARFFFLLTFKCCASLPSIEDYVHLGENTAPKVIGSKGQLSPKISKAIMERLKGQVEPTDILDQHTLLIEVISGRPLVTGNKVTLLIDGPATYDAMFNAIGSAKDPSRRLFLKIRKEEARCNFTDIPPGTYALAVIHDENMNGKLDTNWLGIQRKATVFQTM
jgi:hypothetical protein